MDSVGLSGVSNGLSGNGSISKTCKSPTTTDFNVDGGGGMTQSEEEDRESDGEDACELSDQPANK